MCDKTEEQFAPRLERKDTLLALALFAIVWVPLLVVWLWGW
jgi:hypothetical protein